MVGLFATTINNIRLLRIEGCQTPSRGETLRASTRLSWTVRKSGVNLKGCLLLHAVVRPILAEGG